MQRRARNGLRRREVMVAARSGRYGQGMRGSARPFGDLLREWRERRHVSQLALACDAQISTKHLSFLETGRSSPSREMVLRLSRVLAIPLRERNGLLYAAGFAPVYPERSLDDPALAAARRAVDLVLRAHEPYPALAVDRGWNLVTANEAVPPLLEGASRHLLAAPINVLRLGLHPEGLAPRIRNLAQWRGHLLERLERQIEATADQGLRDLLEELRRYPAPADDRAPVEESNAIAVPLELATERGTLSLISTTTIFGTPVDITLSELAVEAFFPADERSAELLGRRTPGRRAPTFAA
jgi:transcriptional regulator with XRE-family HTH domain